MEFSLGLTQTHRKLRKGLGRRWSTPCARWKPFWISIRSPKRLQNPLRPVGVSVKKKSFLNSYDVKVCVAERSGRPFSVLPMPNVSSTILRNQHPLCQEHSSSSPSHIFSLFPAVCPLIAGEVSLFSLMRDSLLEYIKFMHVKCKYREVSLAVTCQLCILEFILVIDYLFDKYYARVENETKRF